MTDMKNAARDLAEKKKSADGPLAKEPPSTRKATHNTGLSIDSSRPTGGGARFNAPVTDFPAPPLRAKEAAAWLGVSTRCLLTFARSGELAGVKRGGTWFFSMPALCDFAGVPNGNRAEGR